MSCKYSQTWRLKAQTDPICLLIKEFHPVSLCNTSLQWWTFMRNVEWYSSCCWNFNVPICQEAPVTRSHSDRGMTSRWWWTVLADCRCYQSNWSMISKFNEPESQSTDHLTLLSFNFQNDNNRLLSIQWKCFVCRCRFWNESKPLFDCHLIKIQLQFLRFAGVEV